MNNIDGDICCYSVASACDGKKYKYKGQIFDSKLNLNLVLKEDGVDDTAIETFYEPEPWEPVRNSVVSYIENIISSVDTDYLIHLTGKSNFRYQLATIQPYKGNRSSIRKPVHLDGIRQFLVDTYGAVVSSNMEADDTIGLAHNVEEDVISTLDKDLHCIPGKHFNWLKNEFTDITEHDADAHFYCQVITGDPTDNILGIYGMGAKAKVLTDIRGAATSLEMFDIVAKEYKCRFGSYWWQFMKESCGLLWILQKRKAPWQTPSLED